MKKYVFTGVSLSLLLIFSACRKDMQSIKQTGDLSSGDVIANRIDANKIDPPTGGSICLGDLTNYLFVFTDGSADANWQGATKGFLGDVAVNGLVAKERTSGGVPYAGTLYTNAATQGSWQNILNQNTTQSVGSTGQVGRINGLMANLDNAFAAINAMTASPGYESVSAASLNGLDAQNGIANFYVINITSGMQVSSKINITGDASDIFILRWDADADASNGYQGTVKFQSGGGIVPFGGLKATNFIHVAGDISSSGGGNNPATPYPQGPRYNNGLGNLIINGSDFHGGGFFTGYWLTTGDPEDGQTHSLSNAIFVGGWYTSSSKFSMTSGTSGVYVAPFQHSGIRSLEFT